MSEWNQQIFEELISDNEFISWVQSGDNHNCDYKANWELNHPQNFAEFEEAILTVKRLQFRGAEVKQEDIAYLWKKTAEQIIRNHQQTGIHNFFLKATRVAAILMLPLLILSAWLFFSQRNLESKYTCLLENKHEQKITVVAPIGARITVDLPDGSMAWLNSGSELSYPVVFNSRERRVHLTGEAYFQVAKSNVPFFVNSLGPEIKVYGTEFNVNSYDNEDLVTVALAEGKVSLNLDGKEEFITPGQVSVFDKKSKRMVIEATDVATYSSWRKGKYIFRNTTLSAIVRILQRQHNVTINLLTPEVGNYHYNATINNESLEQFLQLLSISAPIKYNYKRKEIRTDGTYVPDNIEISADNTRIIKTK